jgi:serine/threonine-protein kinase HipA
MGVSDFGISRHNEEYIGVLRQYSSKPKPDIKEFVFRDFLNVVLGNTDNHGRNTALIKYSEDQVEISPLFDFAPMVLDDAAIARVSKWKEESYLIPNFGCIDTCLLENGFTQIETREFLRESYEKLLNVDSLMSKHAVDPEVKKITTKKYEPFMTEFKKYLDSI